MMKSLFSATLTAAVFAVAVFASCTSKEQIKTEKNMKTTLQLTQEWDKTFPKSDKVEHKKVTFRNRYGIELAADMYIPKDAKAGEKLAALAVSGPFGAVKEQSSGLYAQHMAERGFIAIAFDPSFTGESGGEPRNRDVPYLRVEDYRLAADVLSTFPGVDATRLAVLGICGGGGYALSAAQMDKRFRAVAVVSMFNTGSVRREGFIKSQADSVHKRLHDVADLRAREVQAGELTYNGNMGDMDPEVGHKLPFDMYREGYEYYVETHAHPRALSPLCLGSRRLHVPRRSAAAFGGGGEGRHGLHVPERL